MTWFFLPNPVNGRGPSADPVAADFCVAESR